MTQSLDQAMLYFVDLRLKVRGNLAAREIVDRCLSLLTTAGSADAQTMAQLHLELEGLRAELKARLGAPKPLAVH